LDDDNPAYNEQLGVQGGHTALLLAVREGQVDAVDALLDGGANIDQVSAGDHTSPMLMASINGHYDLVMRLIKRGANPNLASDAGAAGSDANYGHGTLNLGWALNRNNSTYYDPAIASHAYDAANHLMQFVVQNRSGAAAAGLQLTVTTTAGTVTTSTLFSVPPLAIGESYIATLPVDRASLQPATSLTYVTQLTNPPGRTDSVPANNRRSSTLEPPTP
jgi:hypothetical protein